MDAYDAAIVGGAATGSATAFYLSQFEPNMRIAVVEMDPAYEFCSTLRSDGNLRVQFNLEENIRMSLFTLQLLESFEDDMAVGGWRPDPAPRHQGNLFLANEAGVAAAQAGVETQRALGCEVKWLEPDEIARRWPAYRASGIAGATFGPRDGSIDPHAVMHAFRRRAASRGVDYLAAEATAIETASGAVAGLRLADGTMVETPVIVNCAGGWAAGLARTAGVELPVEPVMRTVYTVETEIDVAGLPSVFTPAGSYALPEGGGTFAVARSLPTDPVGFDFRFSRSGFEESVWPDLAATLPAFERLIVSGGWTGIYAVNILDGNAILGEWPALPGFYIATGFSGHGFQHTPAMGRYLAELITGQSPSIDLSRLGPERVLTGSRVHENAGRII